MNYSETINYLFTRLPMFQRKGPVAYKSNLDNTLMLDEMYNHPHRRFKSVHIAGTNGKGSVAHKLASVLQSAGYKTGLYTSPHLKDFRERIRIDGKMIPEDEVVAWVEEFRRKNRRGGIEPSFFELTVIMAFDYFAHANVDIAVIETGLGGRLDSTNIIRPEVSVITNIGLDHTALLGSTLETIAKEKAGIIKKNVPVVIGTTQKETEYVFREKAGIEGAEIYFADKEYSATYAMLGIDGKLNVHVDKNGSPVYPGLRLDLTGAYQLRNLPAVLKTIDILNERGWKIGEESIYDGLQSVVERTGMAGRWQILGNNPLIICDTAHNEDGIKAVVEQIKNTAYKKLHFVFGTVGDKNPAPVLKLLPPDAQYYFVKANIERALNECELKEKAVCFGLNGDCYMSVSEGFESAKRAAGEHDLIFVGGSTFVVSEVL